MSSSIICSAGWYKRITKNIIWRSYSCKHDFRLKCIWIKDFFNKINCKKSLWINTAYGRTIHKLSCFMGHPVSGTFHLSESEEYEIWWILSMYSLWRVSLYDSYIFKEINCKKSSISIQCKEEDIQKYSQTQTVMFRGTFCMSIECNAFCRHEFGMNRDNDCA